ncbi:poly(A)-specific ribonuclease PARN-like isoform X1 [Trichogramma pretiosum]|uniref:poly(A)-specific ribonuclease PARN-like isoform X1 n=1 Tax=Trichogramma pretiosum TaxID=7493 RepID=UPI0006C98955|nr:poly(A)-specific ribonuclease PARN-like isoform X1 [Trichogramma pretiosum]
MEVTRENFQEVLTELDEVLKNASFLAIDGEFTGLNSGPEATAFDTPAQYYQKLRTGSMNFLLVQFGLSVFTHDKWDNKYSQRSYNFYVFPKPFDRSSTDCRFMCQASSIAFLVSQGFDFNKLFKSGIPYLTKAGEEKLQKKIEDRHKLRDNGNYDIIPIPENDKAQMEEICSRLEDFVKSEDESYVLDRYNAFIRRLIHQEVQLRWPDKIRLENKIENGNCVVIAYKTGNKEEEAQREKERREKEKQDIQQAVGLSALLQKIADSGKLIVGHNMLLDLCHIINQFFGPLPESYTEFKSLVHGLFPKLIDTKIISQSAQFNQSVPSILNQLFEALQCSPYSLPTTEDIEDRSYSLKEDKSHEAGYDAYMTGLCFIALSNRLGALQTPEVRPVLADSRLLAPYLNKLCIAKLKDYPHINLVGNDPNPCRDHIFHVTFPKQWRINDLTQLFNPYGGAYVAWLTDTTAYAALHKKDQVSAVVKNLLKGSSKLFSLKRYKDHQASVESENSQPKLDRKRKISEDGESSPTKVEAGQGEGANDVDADEAAPLHPSTAGATKTQQQSNEGWEVASGKRRRKRIRTQGTERTDAR